MGQNRAAAPIPQRNRPRNPPATPSDAHGGNEVVIAMTRHPTAFPERTPSTESSMISAFAGATTQLFSSLQPCWAAVLAAMPDGLELQGLKVAKADFSAKPGAALREPIIVSLLCGVSTVHGDVLACDERCS